MEDIHMAVIMDADMAVITDTDIIDVTGVKVKRESHFIFSHFFILSKIM